MTELDWSQLAHELGSADDLPKLLLELSPDPNANVWREPWDPFYHQGSIYSASPYVLPYLLEAAKSWAPQGRAMPLALASAIVGSARFSRTGREQVVAGLARLAEETADAAEISTSDRVYVMSAALTLGGDNVWGSAIEHLNDEEFAAVCPECGADLYFRVGVEGCFTICDFNPTPQTRRGAIKPCGESDLRNAASWLNAVATRCGDLELAGRIRCLFGTSTCTVCDAPIRVDQAIERFEKGILP